MVQIVISRTRMELMIRRLRKIKTITRRRRRRKTTTIKFMVKKTNKCFQNCKMQRNAAKMQQKCSDTSSAAK